MSPGPFALISLLSLFARDPAPGILRSRSSARRLDCVRLDAEAADARRPGLLPPASPRGDYLERSVELCAELLLDPGVRAPRDEAILSRLDALTTGMAVAAASRRPDLSGRTWMVEVFYPSAEVSAKLSFAAKNALSRQGLAVSDRSPLLAVGDAAVLTRLAPEDAYPAACQRYAAIGSVGGGEALLAVVSRDPRETVLHAGLCVDGLWTWLL